MLSGEGAAAILRRMIGSSRPLRLLVLFQGMWEDESVEALRASREVVLEREGYDVLHWRGLLRALTSDTRRWADRLTTTYRGRIDAVWSNDDQIGCLLAAVLAQRLGLPGASPAAIVTAQHKLLLRRALAAALPHANVRADALPVASPRAQREPARLAAAVAGLGRDWPLFCKPVRASFSVQAARVADARELAAHLRLPVTDRVLLRALARPFAQLAPTVLPLPCPATTMLLEEPLRGRQLNVDGWVERGRVRVLGVVDECMYPGEAGGARHFAGFTYPSRQPAEVQRRAAETAAAAVRAVGYDHGLFNVELFLLDDGSLRVIEINPRAAGQFATFYRAVDGIDVQQLAIRLAAGLPSDDDAVRVPKTAGVAASLVFRRFDGTAGPPASAAGRAWLAATHPGARLWTEPSRAAALRREYRWVGSHRFAVLNHAAADFATLFADGDEAARRLFGEGLPPGLAEAGA